MLIECTSCNTQYNVNSSFPEDGRKVKCARCNNIWIARTLPETNTRGNAEISDQDQPFQDKGPVERDDSGLTSLDDVESPSQDTKAESPDIYEFEEIAFDDGVDIGATEDDPMLDEAPDDLMDDDVVRETRTEEVGHSGQTTNELDEEEQTEQIEKKAEDSDQIFTNGAESPTSERESDTLLETKPDEENSSSLKNEPRSVEDFPLRVTRSVVDQQPMNDRSFGAGTVFCWFLFLGFVSSLIYGAYVYRLSVVKKLPKAAEFYRMAGIPVDVEEFKIEDIQYEWTSRAGNPVVKIQGVVRNLTNRNKNVPIFVFAFHDDQNREILSWTRSINVDSILAREEREFKITLPAPPVKVKSLQVHLSNSN